MKTSKQLRREITELQKQLTLAEQAEQQIDAAADAGLPPNLLVDSDHTVCYNS